MLKGRLDSDGQLVREECPAFCAFTDGENYCGMPCAAFSLTDPQPTMGMARFFTCARMLTANWILAEKEGSRVKDRKDIDVDLV